jgi:hypothetical protein
MRLAVKYKLYERKNDIMKFTDIMVDLDTGDASMRDAYVAAAKGRIDVASAIFEYAATLSANANNPAFIQEAADAAEDAGLPSDPEEASGLSTAAVRQELEGFYDVFVENAKKVKIAAERDMKAIVGLGKKYGISPAAAQNGKFMITFAKPLAQALVRDCASGKRQSIKFAKGVFPTANKAHDLMFAYGNSMARLAAVFGIDISEVVEDPTVQDELALGFFKKTPRAGFEGGTADVDALYKNLLKGSNYAKFDTSGKLATATNVDADDIAEVVTYIYVVFQVSKAVASNASKSAKKSAMEFVDKLCGAEAMRHDESGKGAKTKISKKFQRINDNIKEWANNVSTSADLVVKSFSDAASALGKVATGECEGVTEDGGSTTTESFVDRTSDEDFFEEAHLSKTDKGSLIGAGVGTLVGAGLTAATGGAAVGAIAPLAGLGVIIGDWIGMYKWRKTPAAELIKFIQDMADKIERRKGNLLNCYNSLVQACKVCMNTNDLFTKEQYKAIKMLYAETVSMLEEARSFTDQISGKYPYPSAPALQSWVEAAEDVKKALEKGPANSDDDKDKDKDDK